MDYGLMAAILVWAGAIGLMAINLPDSPWRWVFASLSIAGVATVYGIVRIRRYINSLSKTSEQGKQP
jgi:membrane protein implicated in regulation of membrane protease activity